MESLKLNLKGNGFRSMNVKKYVGFLLRGRNSIKHLSLNLENNNLGKVRGNMKYLGEVLKGMKGLERIDLNLQDNKLDLNL